MIGERVLVRTYSAGVHFGVLARQSEEGKKVELLKAKRIWRWRGANTLNEVATKGILVTEYSRVSDAVDRIGLTEAIEVIPMTDEAFRACDSCGWNQ